MPITEAITSWYAEQWLNWGVEQNYDANKVFFAEDDSLKLYNNYDNDDLFLSFVDDFRECKSSRLMIIIF